MRKDIMLLRSHSLPNLNAFNHVMLSQADKSMSAGNEETLDSTVFMHDQSPSILNRVNAVAEALKENSSPVLNGKSLEVISLALVNSEGWPSDVALAWKHDACEGPHTAFVHGVEKGWIEFDVFSSDGSMRTIEISHDGKGEYLAKSDGGELKSSGEESFFKLMLAIKMGVSVENISEKQAAEFRSELAEAITERRLVLGAMLEGGLRSASKVEGVVNESVNVAKNAPINIVRNPDWVDPKTRMACKYSPVTVGEKPDLNTMKSMQAILDNRINTCRELSMERAVPSNGSWFSFLRGPQLHEPHLHTGTVPTIVISGGSANKLVAELGEDYSLAWHPKNMKSNFNRPEPVYLLVHKMDYPSYASAMKETLQQYPNLHLVGWDGGQLTGFGAARASALAFADTLPYRPGRVVMVDQDVVKTEQTRHTSPLVEKRVEQLHQLTQKPIVGYGVGYPTRQPTPLPFSEVSAPERSDLNSPAQQFVSIQAPFRAKWDDGIYPPYMVAGGEDMLMGLELGLIKDKENTVLLSERIVKKELKGPSDVPNTYWSEGRVQTLKRLFEAERNTPVEFEGERMSLNELMLKFKDNGWIDSHPSDESYNVAACVIERVILRFNKELARSELNYQVLRRAVSV
ncbi:hypothetical protein [Pseudomonas sp. RL_105y_Pfl2_101]|uniref:hypothetical protein n=1 Tax=Pseudomonas sp. RL_105y_Pfl2_101 TaxID=3088708 RepID=UPI0030DC89B8